MNSKSISAEIERIFSVPYINEFDSTWNAFYLVLLGFTGFYWVLPIKEGYKRFVPSFTGFYWFLPIKEGYKGFGLVLLGFT